MKLKKILPHIDFMAEAKIFTKDNNTEKPDWEGAILDLAAASDNDVEYIAELREEGNIEKINNISKGKKYINYHLDTTDDYEAINFTAKKNKYGVKIPIVTFYVRKEK